MVATKDRVLPRKDPRKDSSSKARGGTYLEKFQQNRPSNITSDYIGERIMRSPPQSPRSPSSISNPSYGDSQSEASSYQPKRPQMTPRRVLHRGPMPAREVLKAPRSMSPDYSEKAVKQPRAQRTAPRSPRTASRPKPSTKDPRLQSKKPSKSSKPKGSRAKATPLLSQERRDEAETKNRSKSLYQATYKPPALDSGNGKRKPKTRGQESRAPPQLSSPLAVADVKRKARAETGRRGPPSMSCSIDSDKKDKYVLSDESGVSKDPVMNNRTFKSGTSQSESAHTGGVSTEYSRDTYDDTVGDDTMDEEMMGDETLGDDTTRTKRSLLRYGFSSSLSENTSFGDGSIIIKQQVAWGCIVLSAAQFAILTTQVLLCGVAPFSVNPLLGPYPDAFSEWGGKNTYLLVEEEQYFRYITPIFLHVGYLHLIVNVFFQLETCAYLEREWGFLVWITIYLISGLGSCLAASSIDSNVIGVCSSGALMGLFSARIAQAMLWTIFETDIEHAGQGGLIFERLGGVVCSAAVVFFLTFLTYIDWSGHLGGLLTGLLVGFFFFAHALQNGKTRATIRLFSICGFLLGGFVLAVVLFHYAQYDEELADACNYFRNLYSEDYACECQAFS